MLLPLLTSLLKKDFKENHFDLLIYLLSLLNTYWELIKPLEALNLKSNPSKIQNMMISAAISVFGSHVNLKCLI